MKNTCKQRGVAIVEFALILPLLLLMIFTVTEFGRAVYEYNILTKSVRNGARYLSMEPPHNVLSIAQARNLMVFGNSAGTGTPLAMGLSAERIAAPTWQTAGTEPVINTVTVRISGYTFRSLFPSVFGIQFGNVVFPDITATMRSAL